MNLRKYKDYTILEEQRRMFELMGVESPILTEQRSRYRQGRNKVKVIPGKGDKDYKLVVTKNYQFDPENLKVSDMAFKVIKEHLPISKKHPNLEPSQIVFSTRKDGKKRDVYTFMIVEKELPPKEVEDIKRDVENIMNRFNISDLGKFDDIKLDEPMLFTPPVEDIDDVKTRADKEECPLDPNGPILRKGKKGGRVKILQLMLMDCGYDLPKFGADGDFGKETDEAVREYQENNGLVVDGKAGPNTINSLCECQTELGVDVWEDSKYDNIEDVLQQREKKEEPKKDTPAQEGELTISDYCSQTWSKEAMQRFYVSIMNDGSYQHDRETEYQCECFTTNNFKALGYDITDEFIEYQKYWRNIYCESCGQCPEFIDKMPTVGKSTQLTSFEQGCVDKGCSSIVR